MSEATTDRKEVQLGRYGPAFAVIGVAGLVATAVLGASDPKSTLHSYLFGVVFFMSITLGCFALTMLQHVLQGKWGLPILRIFEAGGGVRNIILVLLLLIPVIWGAHYI